MRTSGIEFLIGRSCENSCVILGEGDLTVGLRNRLKILKKEVFEVGELVKLETDMAISSLNGKTVEGLEKLDRDVSERVNMIEKRCFDCIALYQPVAGDLRVIGSCLKIITDLERISRLSLHIYDISKEMKSVPKMKSLREMCLIAKEMLDLSLRAFREENVKYVEKLSELDDRVDELFYEIYREVTHRMTEEGEYLAKGPLILFIARYLERISDHACKIGEAVIYMVTGRRETIK